MQVMENKNYNTMKLNYSNSGIKTLRASSVIFFVFSILTALSFCLYNVGILRHILTKSSGNRLHFLQ